MNKTAKIDTTRLLGMDQTGTPLWGVRKPAGDTKPSGLGKPAGGTKPV